MSKNILVNFVGRTAAGPAYAYEMTKGLIESGVNVYAIISKNADNYNLWKSLPLKKLVSIETYTNKKEFVCNTLSFFYKKNSLPKEFGDVKFSAIYVPMGTYWSFLISRLFPNVPVYYTLHDPKLHSGESLFNRIFFYITKKEILHAKKIIVLSDCFIYDVVNDYNKSINDILVIPHAAFWQYKFSCNTKSLINYDSKKINFLFFGRIEDYKGLDILLQAYNKLEQNYLNMITLTIAGKGDLSKYKSYLKKLKNINIINKFIPDADIAGFFADKNVVTVLPYKDATQSGVISTAFMFRSLVIASNVGGISTQLSNGEYGVLINDCNVESLYKVMEDVFLNYKDYKKFIKKAEIYIDTLQWPNLAKKLVDTM